MNITFVYQEMVATTSPEAEEVSQALGVAKETLLSYGLDPEAAFEIQIDGQVYQD